MAWTNITGCLVDGNQPYYSLSNVGSLTFATGMASPYGFVSSAYNGTTWAASNNLGIQSSAAHIRVMYNKSGSYSGIKIRITYISNGENNYDYAIFGNSGYTLASSSTYSTTGVLYHARGASSTDPVTIEYVLTASTNFDIMYIKDSSTNSGWDRLLLTFEVDAYNPGGGGSYYYWVGTCIAVSGYTTNSATTAYRLSNSLLSGVTMNAFFLGVTTFEPAQRIQVNTDKIAIWISGTTDNISTSLWTNGGTGQTSVCAMQNGHESTYFQCTGLAYYGTTQSAARRSYTLVTGSTTYYNPKIKLRQNLFKVLIYGDSNTGHTKAFYNVSFGGNINTVAKTGSLGYISILSSAQTTSCPITITRVGSADYTNDNCQPNYECWRQPWGNNQLATKNTLSEIGVSTSLSEYQVLTYSNQSGIYYMDSPSTAVHKCVQLHSVRYKGASSYYRDDTQYAPTTYTGSVTCNSQIMTGLSNEFPMDAFPDPVAAGSGPHAGLVTIQGALGRVKITHFQPGQGDSCVFIRYKIYDNSSMSNIVYTSDIESYNTTNAYMVVYPPPFSVVTSTPYLFVVIQAWTTTGGSYDLQFLSTVGGTGSWNVPFTLVY